MFRSYVLEYFSPIATIVKDRLIVAFLRRSRQASPILWPIAYAPAPKSSLEFVAAYVRAWLPLSGYTWNAFQL